MESEGERGQAESRWTREGRNSGSVRRLCSTDDAKTFQAEKLARCWIQSPYPSTKNTLPISKVIIMLPSPVLPCWKNRRRLGKAFGRSAL